jgi:hypothetical protein
VSIQLRKSELMLLGAAIRLNTIVTAFAFGLMSGSAIWLATVILVAKGGDEVGTHLSLLSVFFAGYSVTWGGAWLGFFWGFVYGGLSGGILYWTYAKTLRTNLIRALMADTGSSQLQAPILLLSGPALGTGLGLVAALQLIATTNWLVLRGTAPYSDNAALLGHYLPGYTVSFVGSLIGAVELFALTFLGALLVSTVYNKISRMRHGS